MTTTQLETYVKDQFNMELYEFIKHKVEVENLYDYELATILNVDRPFIGKLRKTFGMKKSAKFPRQFERTYGPGAVERLKKIIENPDKSLASVARHFGFSREYARQVYKKVYGYPYTEAFKSKLQLRKRKMLANRKNSKHLDLLIKVKESKQLFEESDISAVRSVKRSDAQPGRINLGSHLNQRNSLSARVKTEIDRRLHPCR